MRKITGILLMLMGTVGLQAQTNEYFENFDNNTLSSKWLATGNTFTLSASNEAMQVAYNRTSTSGQWDQFSLGGISVNVDASPYLSVDIKSDLAFKLNVKTVSTKGEDWMEMMVPADNQWNNYLFNLSASVGAPVTFVYVYFDGGATKIVSGMVQIDNFHLGISNLPKDTLLLSEVAIAANKLAGSIAEGSSEGQYPQGSKELLQAIADSANSVIAVNAAYTQAAIDSIAFGLLFEITSVEASVQHSNNLLIDSLASAFLLSSTSNSLVFNSPFL